MLGQAVTPGSQLQSAFTTALASHNINATATVLSDTPEEDDSIQDQIYLLTTTPRGTDHLGAIIGSSVGSGVALLLLATAFVVFGRGWLKNRRLKKQTAACRKVMGRSTSLQHKPCSTGTRFLLLPGLGHVTANHSILCVHCQSSAALFHLAYHDSCYLSLPHMSA